MLLCKYFNHVIVTISGLEMLLLFSLHTLLFHFSSDHTVPTCGSYFGVLMAYGGLLDVRISHPINLFIGDQ